MADDDRTDVPVRVPLGGLRSFLILFSLTMLLVATRVAWHQVPHGDPWNPPRAWTWKWWISPQEENPLQRLNYVDSRLASIFILADARHGWAVGDGGTIVATSDGGATWTPQSSNTPNDLYGIQFHDVQHGWAVGTWGTILATSDGGATWRIQRGSTERWLSNVFSVDAQHAWAAGGGGTIVATVDGGVTWTAQASSTSNNLRDIQFADAQHGWAVGDAGTVVATGDGGATWKAQNSSTASGLNQVRFIDAQHGWAISRDGSVVSTNDGGTTWDSDYSWSLLGPAYVEESVVAQRRASLTSVNRPAMEAVGAEIRANRDSVRTHFTDAQHGWGVNDRGRIVATADGGKTWREQTSGWTGSLLALHFTDAQHGWVVGTNAMILATNDGGATWKAQSSPLDHDSLMNVYFSDPQHGWIVGTNSTILATSDGGATWRVQSHRVNAGRLLGVTFTDARHGWAAGDFGAILASSDGGATWKAQSSGTSTTLVSIHFTDAQHGWAAGREGTIVATRNGGVTWEVQISGTHSDLTPLYFVDALHGWAAGANATILGTSDGGKTWKVLNESNGGVWLNGLYFSDAQHGWVAGSGGTLAGTSDGGATWRILNRITPLELNDIQFIDSQHGWAVGDGDVILATGDGGATWNTVQADSKVAESMGKPSKWFFRDSTHAAWIGSSSRRESHDGGAHWQVEGTYRRQFAPWWWACAVFAILLSACAAKIDPGVIQQPSSVESALASDRPITHAAQDQLGYARIADGLAGFITNPRTSPPLSISITGPWGQGKSSIMALLQRQLRTWHFPMVWFNAWHHQASEQILASFFAHIRDQAIPPWSSLSGLAFRLRLAGIRIARRPAIPAMFTLVVIFCLSAYVTNPDRFADWAAGNHGSTAGTGQSSIAAAAVIFGIPGVVFVIYMLRLFKAFGVSTRSLMSEATRTLRPVSLASPPAARYQFASDFREVCAAFGMRRLVVFIDDIDRCEPAVVPAILGLVNFLMTSGECFVVLGAEMQWVEAAVTNAYKDLALTVSEYNSNQDRPTSKEFVRRYLEKLLNLEVPVTASGDNVVKAMLEERKRAMAHRSTRIDYDRLLMWLKRSWPVMIVLLLICGTVWLGEKAGTVPMRNPGPAVAAGERNSTAPASNCRQAGSPGGNCAQDPNPVSHPVTNALPLEVAAFPAAKDDSAFPWIWVFSVTLVLCAFSALASLRLPRYLREDSPTFQKALEVWSDWLSERHRTPRSFKRFVNKARFLAMLERGSDAQADSWGRRIKKIWAWARGVPLKRERADLISAAIVAYAATLSRQSQWRSAALLKAFPLDGAAGDLQELKVACKTGEATSFEIEYDDLWKAVRRHRAEPSFHAADSPAAWLPPPDIQRLIERVITPDADVQGFNELPKDAAWATKFTSSPEEPQGPQLGPTGPFGVKTLLLSSIGRITRRQWWLGVGLLYAPALILLVALMGLVSDDARGMVFFGILLTSAFPLTFLMIKRLHDLGASAWWALPGLLLAMPVSTFPIVVIVLGCLPGSPGANRFGSRRVFRWRGST